MPGKDALFIELPHRQLTLHVRTAEISNIRHRRSRFRAGAAITSFFDNNLKHSTERLKTMSSKFKMPKNMDFTDFSFEGLDISGTDFSDAENLTWEQLTQAEELRYITLPAGMDFTGASFDGVDTTGIDFSEAKNLTAAQIAQTDLVEITLPAGMDFAGVSITGAVINVDLSDVKNLEWSQLKDTCDFHNVILPAMDFTGVSFDGKDIGGCDFSRAKNLTREQLEEASGADDDVTLPDYLEEEE